MILKNLIAWLWLAAFLWIYRQSRFAERSHQRLFEIGFLPLAILMISPGSATYHFLLLSLAVVCFVKILLDLQQRQRAIILSAVFLVINLPHYLKLKTFAVGWLTPIGYLRLWLLVFFFLLVSYFFYRVANWQWQPTLARKYFVVAVFIASIMTALDYHRATAKEQDGAQWLPLHEKEFDRHLGLLVKTPDLGRERLVFSYGELLDEDYAIFSASADGNVEGQWTPDTSQKFYEPDLAADDRSVLMECINHGRPEIWLSRGKGQAPEFLLEGENPSWHRDGERFAFIYEGKIGLASVGGQKRVEPFWLSAVGYCYDIALSPKDDRLVFCAEKNDESRFVLGTVNVVTEERVILLQSDDYIERPIWSSDAACLVFSWNRDGNRDLWIMEIATRKMQRLTRDPAIDTAPVWDEAHRRILFTSDRGRGLECSTLFWIQAPTGIN
jgi:hypothetical protein